MATKSPAPPAYKPVPGEVLATVTKTRPDLVRDMIAMKKRLRDMPEDRTVEQDQEAASLHTKIARVEDRLRQMSKAEARARQELKSQGQSRPLPPGLVTQPPGEADAEEEETKSDTSSSYVIIVFVCD